MTFRIVCGIMIIENKYNADFEIYNWRNVQMKLKSSKIISRPSGTKDVFYIVNSDGTEHYLFCSRHCNSVSSFYKNGVSYDKAIDFSVAKRNTRICKIMERIPSAVNYIMREYSLI